jgi:hypothetical protein
MKMAEIIPIGAKYSNPGHLLDVRIFPRPGKEIFGLRNGASSISFQATKSSL